MDNLETAYDKLSRLENALILETDVAVKFKLEHQISKLKKEIKEIEEYQKITRDIFPKHYSRPPLLKAPPITAEEHRDLAKLLGAVHDIWIKGQLEDYSLHFQRPLISLEKQALPEQVNRYRDLVLARPDQDNQILPADKAISQVLKDVRHFLLILGEPGAGKTVALLELARDLVIDAQNNIAQPIPVIFNLSTWVENKNKNLFEWLVKELDSFYRIPSKVSSLWLEQRRLFLLLDGLDEVRAEHRASCVAAINDFIETNKPIGMVVCCRLQEYLALPFRLQLEGAVCLQPLTNAQITNYLKQAKLPHLQTLIDQDENLQELAKTPLLLDVMSVAYENITVEEIKQPLQTTLETRQQQLFDRYLDKMFERKRVEGKEKSSLFDQLTWLANKMQQHCEQVFFIEHLRPTYLGDQKHQTFFQYLFGIGMGLWVGILFFIILEKSPMILSGGFNELFLWLFLVGFAMASFIFSIEHDVPETLHWSWKGAFQGAIILSVFIGIPWGIFYNYKGFDIGIIGAWLQNNLYFNAKMLLVLGGMLIGGWFGLFVGGITKGQLPTTLKFKPNQGIHLAIKNLWLIILPFSIGVGVFNAVNSFLYSGLMTTINALLLGGIMLGGLIPIIQHYYVRLLLFANHQLPLQPVTFLNQATHLFLLRRVGGGYKFIHRLILEHLAKKFEVAKQQQTVKKVTALFISSLLIFIIISVITFNLLLKGIINLDHQFLYEQGQAAYYNENYKSAFRILSLLAKENYPEAQFYVGKMYQEGLGVPKNEILAEQWFQRAAQQQITPDVDLENK